jgi:hypothetical protein
MEDLSENQKRGKSNRQKGHQFERHTASILRAELWPECFSSRFMGCAWDDYNGRDLTGTPGFNIQLKAVERLSPGYHEILSKMLKNSNKNIVIHKRNNKGAIVAMTFEDFIKLIKK